jgi:hypothetical protein
MRTWAVSVVGFGAALLAGLGSASGQGCEGIGNNQIAVVPDSFGDAATNLAAGTSIQLAAQAGLAQARVVITIVNSPTPLTETNLLDRTIEAFGSAFAVFNVPATGQYVFRFEQKGGDDRVLFSAACFTGSVPPLTEEDLAAGAKTAITQGVGTYLNNRARLLLSSDPDRSRIARRLAGSADPGNAAGYEVGQGGFSASALVAPRAAGLRVWSEGYLSAFREELSDTLSSRGNFDVVYAGGDIMLGPNVMLGLLGQFDWLKEEELFGDADGQGWMVGPYVGILLGRAWQLDVRAAWGQSDNDLGSVGSFDGDRWLARASLRGNWYSGAWRLTSITELGYVEENQERFHALESVVVPDQSVSLGRFTFGPELAYRIERNATFLEPQVSLQGLWNFDTDAEIDLLGLAWRPDEFYGRVEAGLMFGCTDGGMTLRAVGAYEGIGTSEFDVWSGRVWGSIPLN